MKDVIVIQRRRNFEWQVRDENGALLMRGRERTRPAARYQGYRALFTLLAIGTRPVDPNMPKFRFDRFRSEQQTSRRVTSDLRQLQRPARARPFTLD